MVLLALLASAGFAAALALLPISGPPNGDFALYLMPWMDIIRERGAASMSAEFSAYTPPYIYLLNIASLIEPVFGTVVAVKLINVPFFVAIALGVGAIVIEATDDQGRGKVATAVSFVVPTVLVNAFAIGQADVIFTSLLVGFVLSAMRDKPAHAGLAFGLAVSFKLQAMFLSPLLVYLLLAKQMRIRDILLIPLVFVAMMTPAAMAGRPWTDLVTIYFAQASFAHELSLNAPNPWWFLRSMDYTIGVIAGLIAGAVAGTTIIFSAIRSRGHILMIATVCAAVMPYVLPKMTARYFFVADVLVLALAFTRPNLWPAAVLIQFGSLMACLSYFSGFATAAPAFIPMTFGIALLLHGYLREGRSRRPARVAHE